MSIIQCFINQYLTELTWEIFIEPINEIDVLRVKIWIKVLMEYFSLQMKTNKACEIVYLLKNYIDYIIF